MIVVGNIVEKAAELQQVQANIRKWEQEGYSPIAIMYFLGQKYPVSLTLENDQYFIMIP